MSFLKAEWRKLAIANYEVDPSVLIPFIPFGTELDLWQGRCYVSLVGFRFVNTRLLGLKIPFHINFEEVNLRFYVKRLDKGEWKRGVVFIKEIVPRAAITLVANTIYKENYETWKMRHHWSEDTETRSVSYGWKKGADWHEIKVTAALEATSIEEGSETEFITEHYWGYARIDESHTSEYEVTHPKWEKYEVLGYDLRVDYGEVYGQPFRFLNEQEPVSVMLAEGSGITVEHHRKIKSAR